MSLTGRARETRNPDGAVRDASTQGPTSLDVTSPTRLGELGTLAPCGGGTGNGGGGPVRGSGPRLVLPHRAAPTLPAAALPGGQQKPWSLTAAERAARTNQLQRTRPQGRPGPSWAQPTQLRAPCVPTHTCTSAHGARAAHVGTGPPRGRVGAGRAAEDGVETRPAGWGVLGRRGQGSVGNRLPEGFEKARRDKSGRFNKSDLVKTEQMTPCVQKTLCLPLRGHSSSYSPRRTEVSTAPAHRASFSHG